MPADLGNSSDTGGHDRQPDGRRLDEAQAEAFFPMRLAFDDMTDAGLGADIGLGHEAENLFFTLPAQKTDTIVQARRPDLPQNGIPERAVTDQVEADVGMAVSHLSNGLEEIPMSFILSKCCHADEVDDA